MQRLQVRLSLPDFASGVNFSDPVIIQNADNIRLIKTLNSSDESISFEMPSNDPKTIYINKIRWWECYDTITNTRLNYGPLDSLGDASGETRKVSGSGRSALLKDFQKTVQTFYNPVQGFFNDLTLENIAGEPRTKTIIATDSKSSHYGLSKATKDNAIDEITGFIAPGRDSPSRNIFKTDSFWSGTGRSDYLIVDLGDNFTISRANISTPTWGGVTAATYDRRYDWELLSSTDNVTYTSRFDTGADNKGVASQVTLADIAARYWKVNIYGTHAWKVRSGIVYDEWDWECGGSDTLSTGQHLESPTDGTISTKTLTPNNNCYASITEIGLHRKILDVDFVSELSQVQIESNNRQITYYHAAQSSEMITTSSSTIRKFEPGQTFRKVTFAGSGSINVYDENNSKVYDGSANGSATLPSYTRSLRFEGSSNVHVTYCDSWKGKSDPLSFAGEYSYTTLVDDTATIHFRGGSLKWWATIPQGSTPGQVRIQLRQLGSNGNWDSWGTLEEGLTLPTNISASVVYEITYESGLLEEGTVYELSIRNLNGGYVSIDAITGYWSASFEEINEDDARFHFDPRIFNQVYDANFSHGTAFKFPNVIGGAESFGFNGDRLIVYGKKGPDCGSIRIRMNHAGASVGSMLDIPGSDNNPDGILVNCKSNDTIPSAVLFDTNDYWGSETGLPWGNYGLFLQKSVKDGPIFIDGLGVHNIRGLSVKFVETDILEIVKNTAQVLANEWDVTESGLTMVPRIGSDTWEIMKEGTQTVIKVEQTQDVTKIATMLTITGSDIDGLPLTAVVEDRNTRKAIGRTIQRNFDLRDVGSYFTLISAGRTELKKRANPERRITIEHSGNLNVSVGDSFIVKTQTTELRVRLLTLTIEQSKAQGVTYTLECEEHDPSRTVVTNPHVKPIMARYGKSQAQALIDSISKVTAGQAQASILGASQGFGEAQADIKQVIPNPAQALATIKSIVSRIGQAQTTIKGSPQSFGEAQANILRTFYGLGQAQSDIKAISQSFGQVQSYIIGPSSSGLAQASIVTLSSPALVGPNGGLVGPGGGFVGPA